MKSIEPSVRRGCFLGVALAACFLMVGSSPAANTRPVTTLADSGPGSLRAIIAASSDGDTADCRSLAGTISLTSGALTNGRAMIILGPGAKILTISGNTSSRVFNILSSVTGVGTVISGLTLSGGFIHSVPSGPVVTRAQGGGILNAGTLTLMSCTITANLALGAGDISSIDPGGYGEGGGIFSSGTLTLLNCQVRNNSAAGGPAAS